MFSMTKGGQQKSRSSKLTGFDILFPFRGLGGYFLL
jgi:hypothetical protein